MALTDEEKLSIANLKFVDDDNNIRYKYKIKQKLRDNKFIIHFLHRDDLDEEDPDSYFGSTGAIRDYFLLPETITTDQGGNFICFDISWDGTYGRYTTENMQYGQIIFYVLCDGRDLYDSETGLARHDLLAALLKKEFANSNLFGCRLECNIDQPRSTDTNYVLRTITFKINALKAGRLESYGSRNPNDTRNVMNEVKH